MHIALQERRVIAPLSRKFVRESTKRFEAFAGGSGMYKAGLFAGHSIEVLITATLDNGYEINVNGVAG